MTVIGLLDKYNVPYTRIKSDKAFTLFKVGETNVLFWINDNNVFKMKRKWFELLENDCKQYVLFLYDKQEKKYFL